MMHCMIPAEVHLVLQNMHLLNILIILISLSFIKKKHGHYMIQHKNFMDFWTPLSFEQQKVGLALALINTRALKKLFQFWSYLHLAL